MARENAQAVPSGALWERDAELAAVSAAVDGLCEGHDTGGLLVFTGEAGIGKTAVLGEVERVAAGRCTVWTARGGETVTSVPFHVVRQLLQPALVSLGPVEAREYLGDWYEIAGPALGIAQPGGRQVDPQGVVDGLVAAVSRLVMLHWPLILVIDDAHWADQESLRWLAAFAERLDDLPVLLVVAHRDGEATGDSARHLETVGRAARPGTSLATLTAFTPDATAGLTRATLGEGADDPFCREVWAVTGGNPYETVELLAKVRAAGMEPVESTAGALRELNAKARGRGLVATLEGLGTDATKLAWSAAVLGTNITLRLAAELTGLGTEDAAHGARLLREARILTGGDDALEFVHPLIATAVYQSVPAAARTALHGQAAWAVTRSGRSAAEASRHLLEVHPDDDPEIVDQLRRAAREHLAVGAPEAAYRCLERALAEPPLPETHATVLYELGCAALLTSPNGTVAHLRAALAMDGLEPGTRTDADALERSRVLREIAQPLTGRDNSERALLILRAFDAMTRGENAELVVELCDRALVNGRLAPGLGWTDTEWSFELLIMLGGSYLFADRLDRAEALFAEALRIYEISGWSGGHLAIAHAFVGYVHRRRGRLVEAEGYLRESLRLADRVGEELPMHWDAACMLIDTLLCRGHLGKAQEIADRYHFGPPYPSILILPDAQSVRGRLLLAQGRTKEAIDELESASHAAAETDRYNTVLAPWQHLLARAVAPRDPRRAAELAADARRQAERFGTDTAIGEALRCAAALETGQRATSLLARAVAYLESSPCAYEHAEARVAYGIAARDAGELTRGLTLARACGADTLAARARDVLREGRGWG